MTILDATKNENIKLALTLYYKSLMDVEQNLIFVTLYLYLLLVINDSIFKIKMLTESGILLKNHVSCNLC